MRQRTDTGRSYAGTTMHAGQETNGAAIESIRHVGSRVLDVGAGSGAFSLRRRDVGWHPTTLDAKVSAALEGIRFSEADVTTLSSAVGRKAIPCWPSSRC